MSTEMFRRISYSAVAASRRDQAKLSRDHRSFVHVGHSPPTSGNLHPRPPQITIADVPYPSPNPNLIS